MWKDAAVVVIFDQRRKPGTRGAGAEPEPWSKGFVSSALRTGEAEEEREEEEEAE
jgi:hypothetical protein